MAVDQAEQTGARAIIAEIGKEFGLAEKQAERVVGLLDEGNTIPFLARYRKEQTGGLDEDVLRRIQARLAGLRNLAARKEEVLRLIEEQGALTPDLRAAILEAATLQRVEDLYRPHRPKRRTRAGVAKEQGLEPLAQWLLSRPRGSGADIEERAASFTDPEKSVPDASAALAGARDIIAEHVADDPEVRAWLRSWTWANGTLKSRAVDPEAQTPFEHYYEYSEAVSRIRPHRVLAIDRGEREEALRVRIEVEKEAALEWLRRRVIGKGAPPSPADPHLAAAVEDAYARLLAPAVERDVRGRLTETAHEQAIEVFAANLRSLLLAPPLRGRVVMGFDPAYRTGCKLAVVDPTGRLLEVGVVYPTPPHNQARQAETEVLRLIDRHAVDVIALGNGTASREAEVFLAGLIPKASRPVAYCIVDEAGASVYSASDSARAEFPDLDVSERSAVSIARRLQDPLAELVKIDPKSIGVGQYQHDVAEKRLSETLDGVVESAVNTVGVDVNTASADLLRYVAGVGPSLAAQIVQTRQEQGPFRSRAGLAGVPRLGPKTFEQCAGFLRIPGGENPLDETPIHPESYPVAERLLEGLGFAVEDVAGPRRAALQTALQGLDVKDWARRLQVGEPTLADIIDALRRPGRDPRDELPPPVLRKDVMTMEDLRPGQVLRGTVRNVVDFGAFVDIGVHQDGLVHVSELSERYVKHPLDAVSVGDVVTVRVLSVDPARKRIALSMKDAE